MMMSTPLVPSSVALAPSALLALLRSKWLEPQPFGGAASAAFERLIDGLRFIGIAHLVVVLRDAAGAGGRFHRAQFAEAVLRATGLGGAPGNVFAREPLPLFDAVDPSREQSATIGSLVSGLSALCLSDSEETCAAVFNLLDSDQDGVLSRVEFGDFVRSALRVARRVYPDIAARVKMARAMEAEFRHEDTVLVDMASTIEHLALSGGDQRAAGTSVVDFACFSRWFSGDAAEAKEAAATAAAAKAAAAVAKATAAAQAQVQAQSAAQARAQVAAQAQMQMQAQAQQLPPPPRGLAAAASPAVSRFAYDRGTPPPLPPVFAASAGSVTLPTAAPRRLAASTPVAATPPPLAPLAHLQMLPSAASIATPGAAAASMDVVSSLSASLVTSRDARARLMQELTSARDTVDAERRRAQSLALELDAMRSRAAVSTELALAENAAAADRSKTTTAASLWEAARRGDINEVHTMLYAGTAPAAGHAPYKIASVLGGSGGDIGITRLRLRYFELCFRVGRRRYLVPTARVVPGHHVVGVYDPALDVQMNEELRAMHTRQRDRDEWRRVALYLRRSLRLADAASSPYHVGGNDEHLHAFVHQGVDSSASMATISSEIVERHRGRLPASYINAAALADASMDGNVEGSAILLCAGSQAISIDWPGDRSDVKINWGEGIKCV